MSCTSTGQPAAPTLRKALIIPSAALPAFHQRMISRQSSFSVISTSEHEEFEWFDAAESAAALTGDVLSSPSFTIEVCLSYLLVFI